MLGLETKGDINTYDKCAGVESILKFGHHFLTADIDSLLTLKWIQSKRVNYPILVMSPLSIMQPF